MKMQKDGVALNHLNKKMAISLNNKYYTFSAGKLFEHNREDVNRNTFYGVTIRFLC